MRATYQHPMPSTALRRTPKSSGIGFSLMHVRNLRWLAAILLVIPLGDASADPVQWSGNGHFYDVVSAPGTISWEDAEAAASAAGGYLATITSREENDFVFSLVNKPAYWHGYSGPWLGGYQSPATLQPTGNWRWVTGEAWAYTNWQAGQPNDSGGKEEDKLQFGFGTLVPTWNDIMSVDPVSSYRPVAYVVEIVPEPSTLTLITVAGICPLLLRGRHIKIRNDE